ncbi:MAG: bifunctional precorrin-2 dehydrogenase/sirohydrochlorin ferrochelatase [Candidatus Atribacteria bacterium]|nr:bifunctional precorrin-2 dehydrogenase/sirohydrochlorin ferrochelatase [Candidatus Atribacteria bacterium]
MGGGQVACRKIQNLLTCDALITVVAPKIDEEIRNLQENGYINVIRKKYEKNDLGGYILIVAASDDRDTNQRVACEALERELFVNVVDDRELSSFIIPSVLRRGDLTIAVSTSGKSPFLSKAIRERLEEIFTWDYLKLLENLETIRERIKNQNIPMEEKGILYKQIIKKSKLF